MCAKRINNQRPVATDSKVASGRYERIKSAMSRYNEAFKNGYHIECIALMESALCDRLESYCNYIDPSNNYSYQTVGFLSNIILQFQQLLPSNLTDVVKEIKEWSSKRNFAIHEMVKLQPDFDKHSFKSDYDNLRSIAADGKRLFGKIDRLLKQTRTIQKKNNIRLKLKSQYLKLNSFPPEIVILGKYSNVDILSDASVERVVSYLEDENGRLWPRNLLVEYYERVIVSGK